MKNILKNLKAREVSVKVENNFIRSLQLLESTINLKKLWNGIERSDLPFSRDFKQQTYIFKSSKDFGCLHHAFKYVKLKLFTSDMLTLFITNYE
ncbi:CLUMA_CG006183, isoform A [Clunio marinus]|uniref:CLUMA_CG006183, isoform A n=1 Tax=Clunio marinus TaxID=568069 RepID=A0A1J1HZ77_9DIPT|nr:CLUMA_CG006183, isoform A [Clunio marinus]